MGTLLLDIQTCLFNEVLGPHREMPLQNCYSVGLKCATNQNGLVLVY